MKAYRIGAVAYVLWGLLHVGAGAALLHRVWTVGGARAIALIGSAVPVHELPVNLSPLETGVIAQHAWNLLLLGVFAAIVGAVFNWRNSRPGYWLNLLIVGGADIGFIFAIQIPGYIKLTDGIGGPLLWIVAMAMTTLGVLRHPEEQRGTLRMPPLAGDSTSTEGPHDEGKARHVWASCSTAPFRPRVQWDDRRGQ